MLWLWTRDTCCLCLSTPTYHPSSDYNYLVEENCRYLPFFRSQRVMDDTIISPNTWFPCLVYFMNDVVGAGFDF